jgi:hypothetical protein
VRPETNLEAAKPGAKILPFDASRSRRRTEDRFAPPLPQGRAPGDSERPIAAIVTVTRFIDGKRLHAQVPVFADEIVAGNDEADHKLIPELSELLADGAVEANSFLDRVAATTSARSLAEFSAR